MEFNSPASLSFLSSVGVTASLFYHEDLLYLKRTEQHRVGWVAVQDCVARQVQFLHLPESLKEGIQRLVQPVGDQIRKWLCKNELVIQGKINLCDKLSWTSHAMIDYMRTAENLLKSGELDPVAGFSLACMNGIADYVYLLWDEAKSSLKGRVNRNLRQNKKYDPSHPQEVTLWTAKITNQTQKYLALNDPTGTNDFFTFAFQKAIKDGNTASARHFITKIEPDRRPQLVRESAIYVLSCGRYFNPATLLFLLSQMDSRQIDQLFIENVENALVRFLEWPLQKYFINLADKLWNFMSQNVFHSTLQAIVQRVIQHHSFPNYLSFENPYVYEDIFKNFWQNSPDKYRKLCTSELITPIISYLFNPHGYLYATQNLFKDANSYEKLEILFFSNAESVLRILANENKAKAFRSLIQDYFPPEAIVNDFEDKYVKFTRRYLDTYYGNI